MKLKIKVTKEILEASKMCQLDDEIGMNCAIARSVRDIFPQAWISHFNIYPFYFGGDEMFSIELPQQASQFITKFDGLASEPESRVALNPVEFEIDVPEQVIETIGIEEAHRIISESKTLELV